MNILFISTNYPYPADSGHHLRTFYTLKYLAQDNRIYYLAFKKKHQGQRYGDPIREMCETIDVFVTPDDYSRIRMTFSLMKNLVSDYPYVADKYYSAKVEHRIKEVLSKNKIDVVHLDLLPLTRYLNNFRGIPVALTEHNVESSRLLSLVRQSGNIFFKMYMYLQYKKLATFEREEMGKCEICIAVSEKDKEVLSKFDSNTKITVIPNGVDVAYFSPKNGTGVPKSMIWVGGMKDFYNRQAVNYFCEEIFDKIKKEVQDVRLTMVGKSPTKKVLELAEQNKDVRCIGYVEDVRPYINEAMIFIAPILSGGGTKLKVLNALAMGKAVVTTSVGAEGIDVTDGDNVIIADHPDQFAKETVELLKNREKTERIGKKARELVLEKYDWEKIGKRYSAIYEELVDKYRRGNRSETKES
jgi:glycosyltransferase involved in cell wall biosynthesis